MEGESEFKVQLGGEEKSLVPGVEVATDLSKIYGGLINAQRRLLEFDFDSYVVVVAKGLGIRQEREMKTLREQIYNTGPANLQSTCVAFIGALTNGGRRLEDQPNVPQG